MRSKEAVNKGIFAYGSDGHLRWPILIWMSFSFLQLTFIYSTILNVEWQRQADLRNQKAIEIVHKSSEFDVTAAGVEIYWKW